MEIKDILRNKRIELGLTMKDVAKKVGVSEGTVSRWESGEIADMKRSKIALLAEVLHLSPYTIMGLEDFDKAPAWYLDPETAQLAQEVFEDPATRMLFDAARDARPEDIKLAAEMLKRLKETNPDG